MSGEGFLSRWSRRKRGVEAGEPEPEAVSPSAEPVAPAAPEAAPEAAPATEREEFDLSSLPDIEELTLESDISAFLRPGVPQALRGAALRRIWSLDPAIRDFVGPADYAWDYNVPDGVPGFALELGGEVKKLLAQAIGLNDEEEAKPEQAAGSGEPPAPDSPAQEMAPDMPAEPPRPAPLLAAAPDAEPPPPDAERAAPRRRHGGALPS